MSCTRCHGLMVPEDIFDLLGTRSHDRVWRCICCGYMLDRVILANRRKQAETAPHRESVGSRLDVRAA